MQHDAHAAVAVAPHGLEDLERGLGVLRALHVDADEELEPVAGREDAAQVVHADGAVDVEAELRELERDVALDTGPRHVLR